MTADHLQQMCQWQIDARVAVTGLDRPFRNSRGTLDNSEILRGLRPRKISSNALLTRGAPGLLQTCVGRQIAIFS